ncbi:MAG: M16 family metallopeptidase [Mangrovibacterium sp.]
MRKLVLLVGLALLSSMSFAQQFTDLSKKVPSDASIKTGVLPNGLTYYIKHNELPKNQASFYIYQNVGAALETDAQDGLAHFLEHMAFNGTHTFPGKSMLNMLEKNGVKFGRDVNAYTTRNETVYNISRVPVKDGNLVDSCLIVLHDWCDNLELSEEEIDAERGVISEEWRTRRNAGFRTREKTGPILYNNTVYAYRDVIGDLDVIKNFKYDELRSFYHDWYRTDLQAVAIVGDIDVDAIEQKIIEIFSAIPAIENPQARRNTVIPDSKETGFIQVTDPDYKTVSVSMSERYRTPNDNTLQELRDSYVRSFFVSLINDRLKAKQREGHTQFLSSRIGFGNLERDYLIFEVSASAKPEKTDKAFAAVYAELQRVIQFGFTEEELNRQKTNTIMSVDNRYEKRDKVDNDSYCKQIKSTYLNGDPARTPEFERDFVREVIPTITTKEVADVAKKYFTGKNRNYIVTGPTNESDSLYISAEGIEKAMAMVEGAELKPYKMKALASENLLDSTPAPGKIIAEKKIEKFDAKEWTLSNGAKVVFKFCDYDKKSLRLSATSEGGSSQYGVEDLPSFNATSSYVGSYGLGVHDADQIKQVMTGKSAGSSFGLSTYSESVSANTAMGDVETMMQLAYMRFRAPRFDEKMFNRVKKQTLERLATQTKTTDAIMKDTISTIESNGNPRALKYNKEFVEAMDFNRMVEIYKERYANPADFTFFIVGDIEEAELKTYVEKYIASIEPTNTVKEKGIYHGDYFPKGENAHRINLKMEEPKATVVIKQKMNTKKYNRTENIYQGILGSVLSIRYTENIREKEGGTYGVSVKAQSYRSPKSSLNLGISFNCDPDKADHLKSLVYKELDIAQNYISQDDLDKVVLNMKKNLDSQIKNSDYWMSKLSTLYKYDDEGMDTEEYADILDKVTTKDIQKVAKKFFKKANTLEFVILPE